MTIESEFGIANSDDFWNMKEIMIMIIGELLLNLRVEKE